MFWSDTFTVEEERALRRQMVQGRPPQCPRCGGTLDLTLVHPRADVAYVRERVLIQCRACRLKVVLDRG